MSKETAIHNIENLVGNKQVTNDQGADVILLVGERARIKAEEAGLKARTKTVNASLSEIFESTGFKAFCCSGIGTVSRTEEFVRLAYPKEAMIEAMLAAGVASDTVVDILKRAEKQTTVRASVKFNLAK